MRVVGTVNVLTHLATLDLWFGPRRSQRHYRFLSPRLTPQTAAPTVRRVETDIRQHHYAALYSSLPTIFQTGAVKTALTHTTTSGRGNTLPTTIAPTGPGRVVTTVADLTFFIQPVSIHERNSQGRMQVVASHLYLLWDNGSWRFFGTD